MAAITEERIKSSVRKAEDAFWVTIAKEFPEATSGDLDPNTVISLSQMMERAGPCLG